MRKLITVIISALLTSLFNLNISAQSNVSFVEKWRSFAIPTVEDTLIKYNHGDYWPRVSLLKNKVIAKGGAQDELSLPFKINVADFEKYKFQGNVSVQNVDDGYLIGFNHGEFGSSLFWFSKDGKSKKEIKGGYQVAQFITKNRRIFAIEGLAHMGFNYGSIIELTKKDSTWVAEKYLKLPKYPNAIAINGNNFFVVTPNSC